VCLDSRDDGGCGLTGRSCALDAHLEALLAALLAVDSPRIDDYAAAVRAHVCSRCDSREADGVCRLREAAACALDAYLPLVIEAIEEVQSRRRSHA